jgi:triacylglycerol lipase
MPIDVNSRTIIFVPGIFGWGPDDLAALNIFGYRFFRFTYFGDAVAQFNSRRFTLREVKCGPVSSFHDRACEIYAQIRGKDVDYGLKHSTQFGHAQTVPREKRPNAAQGAIHRDWSADNPIILVAHSAGAHTCLKLQHLLANDFWKDGTNANWIEAIICVSGVLNGSTLAYHFGCDPITGRLQNNPSRLINAVVDIANFIPNFPGQAMSIPLWLEHWTHGTNQFVAGEDNLAYDLTLKGCCERNKEFVPNKNTYYLSVVTSKPPHDVNPILRDSAIYQSNAQFSRPNIPLPGWGTTPLTDAEWHENDGAVSEISQRYPFTCINTQPGEHMFFQRSDVRKGKWYYEFAEDIVNQSLDHLDPVFGAKLKRGSTLSAQHLLYQKLNAFLEG